MKLQKLFDITPKNVLQLINDENTKNFLELQRKDLRLGLRLKVPMEKGKFKKIT